MRTLLHTDTTASVDLIERVLTWPSRRVRVSGCQGPNYSALFEGVTGISRMCSMD